MSALSEKLIELLSKEYTAELLDLIKFWDKPTSLKFLTDKIKEKLSGIAEILSLDVEGFVEKSLFQLKNELKNRSELKEILNYANNSIEEDILSEILIQCGDPQNEKNTIYDEIIYSENLLETIESKNDLISKIESYKERIGEYVGEYGGAALMSYYIVKMLIDIFETTDFPSIFRLKYLQKLLRTFLSSIWNKTGESWDKLKNFLKSLDAFSIAIGFASSLYLRNLFIVRKQAEDELNEDLCDTAKNLINSLRSDNREPTPLIEENIACNTENRDNIIVAKKPLSDDLPTVCDLTEEEFNELSASIVQDRATKAIIRNNREDKLIPSINIGSKVTDETIIGTVGDHSVYSPTNGHITNIQPNRITLSDIYDNSEDYLSRSIKLLNEQYKELNEIKYFIYNWQIKSIYPVMLANSPETDGNFTILERASILYRSMVEKYDEIKKSWRDRQESYEKKIKKITGKDNVEKHAENDTIYKIKDSVDNENIKLDEFLKNLVSNSIEIAKVTNPKKNEFILAEYYLFELGIELNIIKEPSSTEKKFRDQINIYTEQRYVLDKLKPKKIENKIDDLLKDLEKGITTGNWFDKGIDKYKERKKFSDLEKWVNNIESNKEEYEQELLRSKILYLYKFYLESHTFTTKYAPDPSTNQVDPSINKIEEDNKAQVIEEGTFIYDFFSDLRKRFDDLFKEIDKNEKIIEDLSIFSPFTIEEDSSTREHIRLYTIAKKENECEQDTPAEGFGSIRYWLKYCAGATLASVTNPATGWSTGFISPPILFPTVYVPIKPISTKYGFIVIGLSITGIYVFPFVLMTNYSTDYAMPLFDPTQFIREQINNVKKSIADKLKSLQEDILVKYLNEKEEQINEIEQEINLQKEKIKEHKLNRPSNSYKSENEYNVWDRILNDMLIPLKEKQLEKFKIEILHQSINDAVLTGQKIKSISIEDIALKTIQDVEEIIEKQFQRLDELVGKIDLLVAPLPTTLKPNTTYFGFTLKNPRPTIKIAENLDDNINEGVLNPIIQKFKPDNEKYMTGNAKFNLRAYNTALDIAKALPPPASTIKKDPFPAYENLKITNIQWLVFLYKDFVPKGAKTYGFPGQLPLPI